MSDQVKASVAIEAMIREAEQRQRIKSLAEHEALIRFKEAQTETLREAAEVVRLQAEFFIAEKREFAEAAEAEIAAREAEEAKAITALSPSQNDGGLDARESMIASLIEDVAHDGEQHCVVCGTVVTQANVSSCGEDGWYCVCYSEKRANAERTSSDRQPTDDDRAAQNKISTKVLSEEGEVEREAFEMIAAVERGDSEVMHPAPAIPEGFTKWEGGECPVKPETMIEFVYAFHDGKIEGPISEPAGKQNWTGEEIETHYGSQAAVKAYRIIQSGETPSEPDKPLIADDLPTIPRSEIPEGVAVETFTDSGVETVKLSGLTHIVTDEPERKAETQPEAAYAPIHNVDEPERFIDDTLSGSFARGKERDAELNAAGEEAERLAEAEEKPGFWSFGRKKLVTEGA